jgi:dATP pyrophosphohydrolase
MHGETSVDEIRRVLEPETRSLVETDEEQAEELFAPNVPPTTTGEPYDISGMANSLSPTSTPVRVSVVDVYVIDPFDTPWQTLALQRGPGTRCTDAWEAIHGRIESDETPVDAALRELREETGLKAERLYNVTVHSFYLHQRNEVQLAIVFCAFVRRATPITLGDEHRAHAWLSLPEARERLFWPRATQALNEIEKLFTAGNAGPAEDVLRVI